MKHLTLEYNNIQPDRIKKNPLFIYSVINRNYKVSYRNSLSTVNAYNYYISK